MLAPLFFTALLSTQSAGATTTQTNTLTNETVYALKNKALLRTSPSKQGAVKDALPLNTEMSVLKKAEAGYVHVRIRGTKVEGFVHESLLSKNKSDGVGIPKGFAEEQQCPCSPNPEQHRDHHGVNELLKLNATADRDYCVQTRYDGRCSLVRPSDVKNTKLKNFEASIQSAGLSTRLLAWTLAFAPESVYRHLSSIDVLNASPLMSPVKATPHPRSEGDETLAKFANVEALKASQPAPKNVWMYNTSLSKGRLVIREALGISGGFPASKFKLGKSFRLRREGNLRAALWNPCLHKFVRIDLLDLRYDPATGELSAGMKNRGFFKCRNLQSRDPLPKRAEGFSWKRSDLSSPLVVAEGKDVEAIWETLAGRFKHENELATFSEDKIMEAYAWPFLAERNVQSVDGNVTAELHTLAYEGECAVGNVVISLRYKFAGRWHVLVVKEIESAGC